jgi:hypothetical protein
MSPPLPEKREMIFQYFLPKVSTYYLAVLTGLVVHKNFRKPAKKSAPEFLPGQTRLLQRETVGRQA